MFRHVSLFRWNATTTDAQVQALHTALQALPEVIPELRDYRVGPDAGLVDGNWDFTVVAEFDDAEAWRAYLDHPAHRGVVAEHVQSMVDERAAVQYHC